MTHRIVEITDGSQVTLFVEGVLDLAAVAEIRSHCQKQSRMGRRPRVVLRSGITAETGVIDHLVRIEGIALECESPFMARWIAGQADEDREPKR